MISMDSLNPRNGFLTDQQRKNLVKLCQALIELQNEYGEELFVNSGFRSELDQARIDPKHMGSAHREGLAADIADTSGKFWDWCVENLKFVADQGIYLEDRLYTISWVHCQLKAPLSKKRIFEP